MDWGEKDQLRIEQNGFRGGGGMASNEYGAVGGSDDGMNRVRQAYASNDVQASIEAHRAKLQQREEQGMHAEEGHRLNGDSIKSVVYGGLDGVLTSFAIVSGAAGGNLRPETVLILGISNIIADAFSMGVGDVVSTLAYHDHVMRERKREVWEFESFKEGEIEEMIDLYEKRGLPREKGKICVELMAKYKDFFIDVMMCEELQLKVPSEDDNPYKDGLVTFVSFIMFGSMPLVGYVLIPLIFPHASSNVLFGAAGISTMIVLFILGSFKSQFSVSTWYYSGMEFLALGSMAASTSYIIAMIVESLAHDFFHGASSS